MSLPKPKRIKVSDVTLNVYEAGDGPAVVLCHGFPDLARSWKHQFAALVDAGYHVIAADQRGYGHSDAPQDVEAYHLGKLTGDMVGLLDALNIERAVFAGHDWGGFVAWAMPVLHPDRVAGMIGVNVPYFAFPTTEMLSMVFPNPDDMYILWFQKEGVAEDLLNNHIEQLIDGSMRRLPKTDVAEVGLTGGNANPMLNIATMTPKGEALLSREELAGYVEAFSRNGLFGPVSWYRNIDRNAEMFPEIAQKKLDIPVLQIAVPEDAFVPPNSGDITKANCTDAEVVTITNCGHWTMLEQPEQLSAAMVDWLGRKFG